MRGEIDWTPAKVRAVFREAQQGAMEPINAVVRFRDMDAIFQRLRRRGKALDDGALFWLRIAPANALANSYRATCSDAVLTKGAAAARRRKMLEGSARKLQTAIGVLEREHLRREESLSDAEERAALNASGESPSMVAARAANQERAGELGTLTEALRILGRLAVAHAPEAIGNKDLFAEAFIRALAAEWRTWIGEPGRGKSGPFVDYVRSAWQILGLPERGDDSFGALVQRIAKSDHWGGSTGQK